MFVTYGIRKKELVEMRLGDIHWDEDLIVFRRAKSGRQQVFPLDAEVGNAVLKYLLEVRPRNTGLDYLFLSKKAPYKKICDAGLVPIIEPEVDIHSQEKEKCEELLKKYVKQELENWNSNNKIMFKFTIPTVPNLYLDLYDYDCVVRIVALSGGYTTDEAVEKLAKNNKMIASFSRALLQDLNVNQSQEEFDKKLNDAIVKIYNASIT